MTPVPYAQGIGRWRSIIKPQSGQNPKLSPQKGISYTLIMVHSVNTEMPYGQKYYPISSLLVSFCVRFSLSCSFTLLRYFSVMKVSVIYSHCFHILSVTYCNMTWLHCMWWTLISMSVSEHFHSTFRSPQKALYKKMIVKVRLGWIWLDDERLTMRKQSHVR